MSRDRSIGGGAPTGVLRQAAAAATASLLAGVAIGWQYFPLFLVGGLAALVAVLCIALAMGHLASERLLLALWFVLPWTGLQLGGQLLLADLVVVGTAVTLFIHRRGSHLAVSAIVAHPAGLGLLLMTVGGFVGVVFGKGGGGEISVIAVVGPAAILTYITVARIGPTDRLRVRLMVTWVLGAMASVLLGIFFLRRDNGRALGLASHPNQFAMMAVMTLPYLHHLWSRRHGATLGILYLFCGLACAIAVVESGSRSGLVSLVIVAVLIFLRGRRNVLASGLVVLIVGTVLLAVLASVEATNDSQSAIGRIMGADAAMTSDEARAAALAAHFERGSQSSVAGSGFTSAERPHSALIDVWSSAGALGILGFLLVAGVGVWPAVRGVVDKQLDSHLWAISTAFVGYLTVALINNALWNRFVWAQLALVVATSLRVGVGSKGLPSGKPNTAVSISR